VLTKPSHKIKNVGIAPHPGWEALEILKRFDRFGVAGIATYEAIDTVSKASPLRHPQP
jgi:hypothetical protein